MELIYTYVNKFRNIENQEFKLSNKFDFFFDKEIGNLKIINKNDYFDMFKYDRKLSNITAIVGRNGVGKTNLLDIIGGFKKNNATDIQKDDSYFLIYHYKEEHFIIEGINTNLFSEKFSSTLNSFCCSFEVKNNIICNFKFIRRYDEFVDFKCDYETKDFCCVYFSRTSMITRDNMNRVVSSSPEDLAATHGYPFDEYQFLLRQLFSNYNNNLLPIYSFLNSIGDSNYFEANVHPIVSLVLGESFKHNDKEGYVAKSIKDTPENEFEKLSNKQKFILNILYYLNLIFAYEFIDNTKEEWEEILVEKNEKVEIDSNGEIFKNYVKYYLKIYSLLVHEASKLIIEENKTHAHDNESRNGFIEYYEKLNSYVNDKELYYKLDNLLNDIYNALDGINNKFFIDEKNLCILDKNWEELSKYIITQKNIIRVLQLLDEAQLIPLWSYIGSIHLEIKNLSEGEKHLIDLIGGLADFNKEDVKEAIFVFDEPDLTLHPEWNRRLINDLTRLISSIKTLNKYQIIIATHSPFVLSDLPRENVIALKSNEKGMCIVEKIKNNTFANHIHTLLAQDFFMDSTIGEYAKKKINEIINYINGEPKTNISEENINYYFNVISLIGDELLRKKLINMFINSENCVMKKKAIEMQIKELQNELKMINTNGEDL